MVPGECARYLANVPLSLIPMAQELRDTLQALGVHTAGAFAELDAEDVERRLGSAGLLALQLSRGEDRRRHHERGTSCAEAALDRLRAELGAGSVVKPVANNTHRPEQAGGWVNLEDVAHPDDRVAAHDGAEVGDTAEVANVGGSAVSDHATLRLLDPPESAAVECENRVPRVVRWRSRVIRITRAVGPERLSGDWWKDDYRRDYWRCEEENERADLVLYRDRALGEWFVQGWWD